MSDLSQNIKLDDSILYELLVYSEWKQDPEQTTSDTFLPMPKKSVFGKVLGLFHNQLTIPELIYEQVGCRFPWLFCVGEGGKVIAILQDTLLEIRSSKDEYSSVIGKAAVLKDLWPQWRRMAWSPDCSVLAIASSDGVLNFYDLLGCNIFTLKPDNNPSSGTLGKHVQNAVAAIVFLQSRIKEHKWSSEVLLIDYNGDLRSYLVSPTEGFQLSHTFSFSSYYSGGVSAAALHHSHPMLVLSGNGNKEFGSTHFQESGCSVGLSSWRILNDPPYYKLSTKSNDNTQSTNQWLGWTGKAIGIVFKLNISTSGSLLACLHSCGTISIWRMPSLRLVNIWKLTDQPDYNIPNPLLEEKKFYKGVNLLKMSPNSAVDINWWSENAIILSRYSGAISVNSVNDLRNLLGNSPEFLSGQPQISDMLFSKGFIALECESVINTRKNTRELDDELSDDLEEDEGPHSTELLVQRDFLDYLINLMKLTIYLITDLDKFRPEPPRMKLLTRTYRMLGLKSTTPEELYSRKIDAGDYSEALALANLYSLDTDLVYKRQWQNSKVCDHSIAEYLSKITKRWWVLQQCVDRVADSIDASRQLLLFGLRICSINVFRNIDDLSIDTILINSEEDSQNIQEKEEEILNKVDLKALNNDQKELLRYRKLILKYLDRLATYEIIVADDKENFDSAVYNEFRTSSILYSGVKWARQGAWKSLNILFTYYLDEIQDHLFPLLSNLPETVNPSDYSVILPGCDQDGCIIKWNKKQLRDPDWCESEKLQFIYDLFPNTESHSSDWQCIDSPELNAYCGDLSGEQITAWYLSRTREIELRTGIVDNALKLINLGIEKQVKNLEKLHFDLETLDCLVYEVCVDISLTELQQSTKLQRGKWLMSKSAEDTFVNDLLNLFLAFIHDSHDDENLSKMELLKEYILHLSEIDLKWALIYFEHLQNSIKPKGTLTKLDLPSEEIIDLAVKCIYINTIQDLEQIELSGMILECLPDIEEDNPLSNILVDLEGELQCSKLLCIRGIPQSAKELHETRNDVARATELLNHLARSVLKMHPSEVEWNDLLTDLINIRDTVFSSINIEQVFEIYVSTLLLCGQKSDIESAGYVMHCNADNTDSIDKSKPTSDNKQLHRNKKIPYERSVKLVLEAAREYFDSSRSLDDKNMDLSKTCLSLIEDENEEVKEELDLIAAVKILHDFQIPILPIQVRLCPDRLRLIESCLNSVESKPSALFTSTNIMHNYSLGNVILDLAKLLHIYGDDEKKREGAVLEMLTKDTLQKCNWNLCWSYCTRIITDSHGSHWRVVAELARQGESLVTELRIEAIDFAVLHCDPDAIEELLAIRDEIELKELKSELNSLTDAINRKNEDVVVESTSNEDMSPVSPNEEYLDAFSSPLSTVKELPGNITKVIKMFNPTSILKESTLQLMSHISEQTFLKSKNTNDENSVNIQDRYNEESYPCFYASLHENCVESNLYTHYERFSDVEIDCPELRICRILLKIATLENNTNDVTTIPNMDEVLLQYASYALPEDITLGLAILLSLENSHEAKTTFDSFPVTLMTLRTCIYYVALLIVCSSTEYSSNLDILLSPPEKLLQLALAMESSPTNSELFLLLREYRNKLQDLSQAEELQTLGCGVDTQRFTIDENYRRDSILGLAMSPNLDRYNLALKLGTRHSIHLPSIAFEHVSSLLQCAEVPINVLSERLEDKEILYLLKEQPEEMCNRLSREVFPTLDGTQHDILVDYFTLMDKINPDYLTYGLLSKEHIKLLKKIKSSCPVVDYTLLLDPPDNFVSMVTCKIKQDDLPVLCKLLKSLPTQLSAKCPYTQSLLYKEWSMRHVTELPTNSSANAYTACWNSIQPLFSKINAEDFKMFIYHITLSPKSVNKIALEHRLKFLKEAIVYCNERTKQDRIEGWSCIHSEFISWERVLQSLRTPAWQELVLYGAEILKVTNLVQASCTDESLLVSAFVNLLKIETLPLDDVLKAIKVVPNSPSLLSILKHLINLHGTTDGDSQDSLENLTIAMSRLESYVSSTAESSNTNEDPIGSGDWDNEWNIDEDLEDDNVDKTDNFSDAEKNELSEILLPLCGDSKLPSSLRLTIMKILQNLNISSGGEFNSFMLFQHTQATVASAWRIEKTNADNNSAIKELLAEMDISTEQGRIQFFKQLLYNVKEWDHILCLNDLLTYWPKFISTDNGDITSPWYLLLKCVLTFDESGKPKDTYTVLSSIAKSGALSDQTLLDLHTEYNTKISVRVAILFDLFFCKDTDVGNILKTHAVDLINRIEEPLEEDILALIVSKHLVAQVVGSQSYKSILETSLLANSTDVLTSQVHTDTTLLIGEPKQIVEDLLNSRLVAEAGSFGLSSIGTPDSLRSFGSALKWARRLYSSEHEE